MALVRQIERDGELLLVLRVVRQADEGLQREGPAVRVPRPVMPAVSAVAAQLVERQLFGQQRHPEHLLVDDAALSGDLREIADHGVELRALEALGQLLAQALVALDQLLRGGGRVLALRRELFDQLLKAAHVRRALGVDRLAAVEQRDGLSGQGQALLRPHALRDGVEAELRRGAVDGGDHPGDPVPDLTAYALALAAAGGDGLPALQVQQRDAASFAPSLPGQPA